MAANFSSGLAGLSILTGDSSLFSIFSGGIAAETNAVRKARAQFTTPKVIAPWQEKQATVPVSAQVSTIKRMKSVVDTPTAKDASLPADLQTSFLAYKALERLRLLADASAKKTTADNERTLLQTAFAKGLGDLQDFLAEAPSDKVKLTFGVSARRAESVKVGSAFSDRTVGAGVLATRTAALAGFTGSETLQVKLTKTGASDVFNIDLSTTPQPPTLDSVAQALNAAIASVPMRDLNGAIVNDASGNPLPRYAAKFLVEKTGDKWGLVLSAPAAEQVALDQVNAKDALMVATGMTALDAPATTQIMRFDDPATTATRKTLGTIAAVDADATERAKLAADNPEKVADVVASTATRAIATDIQGNSYVVGTAAGDIGNNQLAGAEDLFLTKLDSEGKVVWQRTLGAATAAQGAAVTVGANGDIVVAGTVAGPFDGSLNSDSDMVVVKFDANGNETFATAIRTVGNEEASSIAVAADGTIFIGGKSGAGAGDAFVARLSSGGTLQERRTINSGGGDSVAALAIDGSGELLVLTRESGTARLRRLDSGLLATDLGSLDLGSADARALAVSATGEIAVGGATNAALAGTQVNGTSGGRDGFVARIDAALAGASISYLGTAATDEVDSVAFLGGDIYAGGRTTGALDGTARHGAVDGFVARVDTASGAIEQVNQFGKVALRTEPVRVAAASGGAGVTGALGFHRGVLNPTASSSVVANTAARAGDEFTLRVDGGLERKVVIAENDTLTTLADRIRKMVGSNVTVTVPKSGDAYVLRIEAKAGHSISLMAGADGKDALEKLGIEPGRFSVPLPPNAKAPRVQPGGTYSLMLSDALSIGSRTDAGVALSQIESAISMTQSAYRSLYWDQTKANLVNGSNRGTGTVSAYQKKQLAGYQDALSRLQNNTYTGF